MIAKVRTVLNYKRLKNFGANDPCALQGLVTNGAKVYVCGLESDPISSVESELNELGKASGGTAIGYLVSFHIMSSR